MKIKITQYVIMPRIVTYVWDHDTKTQRRIVSNIPSHRDLVLAAAEVARRRKARQALEGMNWNAFNAKMRSKSK